MKRNVLIIIGLIGLLLPQVVHAKSETVWTDYRLNFVKLVDMKGKELQQRAPGHPVTLPVEKVRKALASVRVHRKAFMKKENFSFRDREVFDDVSLDDLTAPLVDALQRASDDQVVVFSYLFKNGKSILRSDRFSTGKLWVKDNKLHIEFQKLFARIDADLAKRGYSDKVVGTAKGVRIALETLPGQVLASNNRREIILDLDSNFGEVEIDGVDAETPARRLQALQRLREMGLVTKEEFDSRRRAILNQI